MFNNADHALRWAYETVTRPIVKMSGANRMFQIPTKGTPNELLTGLATQEQHGQAGAIIGMVERLRHPEYTQYLTAKFGRKMTPEDISVLIYIGCDATGLGLKGEKCVYRVITSHFCGSIGYRAVRKMLGTSNSHALLVKSCLYELMDHIHNRATAEITDVLQDHGLIVRHSSEPAGFPH